MPGNDSYNLSIVNVTGEDADVDGVAVRAATLVLMQCFIIPGNSLILAAIVTFSKRSVADVLIGCLALIDLMNGLGPVNISISLYYMNLSGSHRLKDLEWLCLLYTWVATCLRLMACFVATTMAVDRFAAIVIPFFYRTRVTPRATCLGLLIVFILSAIIATLPLAINTIRTYIPLCSFDFTSPFAAFIATLGYLQLLIVVLCYLSVIFGVNSFLSRQSLIRATQIRASIAVSKSKNRENTLAETSQAAGACKSSPLSSSKVPRHLSTNYNGHRLRSCSLLPTSVASNNNLAIKKRSQSLTPVAKKRDAVSRLIVLGNTKRSRGMSKSPELAGKLYLDDTVAGASVVKRGSDFEMIHEVPLESEDEEKVQMSLKEFKRNSSTWKHSRRLAIVMGIVVVLFYISWMPIVVAITLSLTKRESRQELHFLAARMTLISAMLNFLVYGGMLKQYRNAYKSVLTKFCESGEGARRPADDTVRRIPRKKSSTHVGGKETSKGPVTKRVKFKERFGRKVQPIE